ncbi:MAG: hypothetical protein ACFHX7_17770 [Pseudomonadota bacterium]
MIYRQAVLFVLTMAVIQGAVATPVDFRNFTMESYPVVTNFGGFFPDAEWAVSADGSTANQLYNSQPSIFYSDFSVADGVITGTGGISNTDDDDQWGFVFGFTPGDTTNANADYLVLDWKQNTQSFNFTGDAATNATPTSTSTRGLFLSRVTGIPSADEMYGRNNSAANPGGGVEQIGRGLTLGSAPWIEGRDYEFRFEYSTTSLKVFVDSVLQFDVTGSFPEGRFGLYTHSQDAMFALDFDYTNNAVAQVPAPLSAFVFLLGMAWLKLSIGARRTRVC